LNLRVTLTTLTALAIAALLLFHVFQRELSGAWFAFGVHPDVLGQLDASLADQKRLARLDPPHAEAYRRRFAATEALLGRLRVLEYTRGDLVRRYELALLGLFGGILGLAATAYVVRQSRQAARLSRLQEALGDLAAGRPEVRVADRRRDLIGRIAVMVEGASRVMSRDRRRLASLENLSSWQEAARRHAHEMRSPLTAAQLELARLRDLLERGEAGESGDPAERGERSERGEPGRGGRCVDAGEPARVVASLEAEIERLGRFARDFTAFARLPSPRKRREDLGAVTSEFVRLFAGAWPDLKLVWAAPAAAWPVDLDREMLRQVLVNLCENSARAIAARGDSAGGAESEGRSGTLTLTLAEVAGGVGLEVADDGPGVVPEIVPRLFEPYATTRRVGEGMGLGLAISRKILLDHGGDLELVRSTPAGATFRLFLPRAA
jgi:nitrogen fixation/metabolism regulation signal transduction histidine kinase